MALYLKYWQRNGKIFLPNICSLLGQCIAQDLTETNNIGSIYFVVREEAERIAKFRAIMKIVGKETMHLNLHMKTFKDINN